MSVDEQRSNDNSRIDPINMINSEIESKTGDDLVRAIKTIIQLYTDKAHFVYELLQNAEDCKAKNIRFTMLPDRLEVLHDGEPFTEADLISILSVADGTKVNDINAIGKFGVGFKSVYSICNTVFLNCEKENYFKDDIRYLDAFSCKIIDFRKLESYDNESMNYVLPKTYTTMYIFPFNVGEDYSGYETIEALHKDLASKLRGLGASVLLFMKHLEEISYSVSGLDLELDCSGTYMLEKTKIKDNSYKATTIGEKPGDDISYLMYKKPTRYGKDVNIAFACKWRDRGIPSFLTTPERNICVYFPTDTISNINFIVQAPYATTPNRGGIPASTENFILSGEVADLLRDAITDIRNQKWLTLEFLNLLPLDNQIDYGLLRSLHSETVSMIDDERILPTIDGEYTKKENAYIVRGETLTELFSGDKLCALVDNNHAKWLPTNLTATDRRMSRLHGILTNQFSVREIQAGALPALLRTNASFWKLTDDEWLVLFYKYLLENTPGMIGKTREFSTVPIIKTEKGIFIEPYIYDQKTRTREQNVYLRPHGSSKSIEGFSFVDTSIAIRCREFLDAMGIVEPDGFAFLVKELDSKYDDDEISHEDEISQVKRALKFLRDGGNNNAVEIFRNKLFLRYTHIDSDDIFLNTCANKKIYREYDTIGISIKEYYMGTECDVGILSEEFYLNAGIPKSELQLLQKIGLRESVVNYGDDEWYEGAQCRNVGEFKKWLVLDNIDDVIRAIKEGDTAKSALILEILKRVEKRLKGVYVRGAVRRDRHDSESSIVEYLRHRSWVVDLNGSIVRTKDITRNELNEPLYGAPDKFSRIYSILGFKEDPTDTLIEKIMELSPEQKQAIVQEIAPIIESSDLFDPTATEDEEPPTERIGDIKRLISKITESYKKAEYVRYEPVTISKRTSGGGERDHIKYRYNGFCQMCGYPSKYWEVAEIIPASSNEQETQRKEMVQMYLSLCPNCASEYRILRNSDEVNNFFTTNLMKSNFGDSEVKLSADLKIYFTQKHLAEIKIILMEMDKT